MSALATASGTSLTVKPAASAFATDDELALKPTTTLTPDSFKLFACAWPCEP